MPTYRLTPRPVSNGNVRIRVSNPVTVDLDAEAIAEAAAEVHAESARRAYLASSAPVSAATRARRQRRGSVGRGYGVVTGATARSVRAIGGQVVMRRPPDFTDAGWAVFVARLQADVAELAGRDPATTRKALAAAARRILR